MDQDRIITGSLAKAIDTCAMGTMGVPSLLLMERAANAVFRCAREALSDRREEVRIYCGTGNNGADGLAVGAMLCADRYRKVTAVICGNEEKATGEFRIQKDRFLRAGGQTIAYEPREGAPEETEPVTGAEDRWENPVGDDCQATALVIDALFGIGLKREVKGVYLSAIREINALRRAGAYVISVDIPSGIDADRGENLCAPSRPVTPDETVTFGWLKTGHCLGYGFENCGQIKVCEIGYPEDIIEILQKEDCEAIQNGICRDTGAVFSGIGEAFRTRDRKANKGSYGKLLIVAGSKGMAGAAYLSGLAAYRAGVGMVKYYGPEKNRVILQTGLPEAMYEAYPATEAERPAFPRLSESLLWADLAILGPGLSRSEEAAALTEETLRLAHKINDGREADRALRLIIDADALNILSERRTLQELLTEDMVLTPHVGELARLTESPLETVKRDPVGAAARFARSHHTNVLAKDCVSVAALCDGTIWINCRGSAAMAKAGSGDVLTGVLAGSCAVLGTERFLKAIPAAAWIHGRAGELAAERYGIHAMLARDLANAVPTAYADLL